MSLVLSIFPGIDLLGRAFEEEGFCVVRGPDILWGGDVRAFHPPAGVFAGVIGGDPCQAFSRLARWVKHQGKQPRFPDMSPEFERIVLEARPDWFLRENVPAAPAVRPEGYHVGVYHLNSRLFGSEQDRERTFWFGQRGPLENLWRFLEFDALQPARYERPVLAQEGRSGQVRTPNGYASGAGRYERRPWPEFCRLQGLPLDYDLPGMTVEGKYRAVGNGVPLCVGRAIASAVRSATALHEVTPGRQHPSAGPARG